MDEETLLTLFDGNVESLEHFQQLREQYREARLCADQAEMCEVDQGIDEVEARCGGGVEVGCGGGENVSGTNDSDSERLSGYTHHTAVLIPMEDIVYIDGQVYSYQTKQTALDSRDDASDRDDDSVGMDTDDESGVFECGRQGCSGKFSNVSSYESHYHSCHHYVCSQCRRVFVSSFMLDIHIQENHDSYFQILSSRIDMFQCLVESCGEKFRTADLRKDHLVKVHLYPANFNFHKPISEKRVALRHSALENRMECEVSGNTADKEGTVIAATKAKQSNICFGRGQQRGFQRRPRQKKRLNIDKVDSHIDKVDS